MVTEEQVLDSMRHIMDPDLGRDIVSLGFIKDISIDDGEVKFRVELTTPACPVKDRFKAQCEEAVSKLPGVKSVTVIMDAMKPRQKTAPAINTLADVDSIIAVSSCKGGVGKSTVAAHLALAMQRQGLNVALLDADVYGPSVPTLFNIHNPQMYVRENLLVPVEVHGIKVMSLGFLLGEAPAVLRGPMVSNYIQQVLQQTDWGKLDYLIVDLPPGTGDIQLTITQQASLDGTVIVTTPQALSLVDVARGIVMFEKVNVPVLGVVENMSSFTCDGCDKVHYPFGKNRGILQERFGISTLAELPIMPDFSEVADGDSGAATEAVAAMADQVHRAVGASRITREESTPEVQATPQEVIVTWPDGFEARLSNHALRCACPCAVCVDEHSGERILDPTKVPYDVTVENVQQLGNYAVAFTWSDGHSTGIYSWDYLRSLANAA